MTDQIIESANNPAEEKKKSVRPANYMPMSAKALKLEVPERDGYYRRWFRGDPARIAKARQAGYEHVLKKDVILNNSDLGGSANVFEGTDMGSIVSVISGDDPGQGNQPGRLYLMECPLEFYEESRKFIDEQNDEIVGALTAGTLGGQAEDGKTYSSAQKKGQLPELFQKNKPRRRL